MANHTKTTTLTDLQQKILANDLYTAADNSGLDASPGQFQASRFFEVGDNPFLQIATIKPQRKRC